VLVRDHHPAEPLLAGIAPPVLIRVVKDHAGNRRGRLCPRRHGNKQQQDRSKAATNGFHGLDFSGDRAGSYRWMRADHTSVGSNGRFDAIVDRIGS